jgi:NADPH:quinone reductase-like Zn-dependent oxidoreductase
MSKNHAIVVQKAGEAQCQAVDLPKLRDEYILVKVKAIAINPTDFKHVDFLTTKGAKVSKPFALFTLNQPFQAVQKR